MSVAGITGTVTEWQSSIDAFTTITHIANTTTSLTTPTLSTTTQYRVVVTSGTCSAATSAAVTVNVDPTSNAGTITITGTNPICGGATTTMNTAGIVGTVTEWQSSTDGFATINHIANTTATLTTPTLAATTQFRVIVTSGTCTAATSLAVTVTVTPGSNAGTISITGANPICQNVGTTTMNVAGIVGTVTEWQSSTDGFVTINHIANTTTNLTTPTLAATTDYRVVVTSG